MLILHKLLLLKLLLIRVLVNKSLVICLIWIIVGVVGVVLNNILRLHPLHLWLHVILHSHHWLLLLLLRIHSILHLLLLPWHLSLSDVYIDPSFLFLSLQLLFHKLLLARPILLVYLRPMSHLRVA